MPVSQEDCYATVTSLLVIASQCISSLEKNIILLENILAKAELNRKGCLIGKTVGVSTGGVGSVLTVVGIGLAPVTAGISLILTITGLAVNGVGIATSMGSVIADLVIQKQDVKKLLTLSKEYEELKKKWQHHLNKSEEVIKQLQRYGHLRDYTGLDVLSCLRETFVDERISVNDLRLGDHIHRKSNIFLGLANHHGLYYGSGQVVHFGGEADGGSSGFKVSIISLSDFLAKGSEINKAKVWRRNYRGHDISVLETIELAKFALENQYKEKYHLFINNCEHFVTNLKLNQKWSGQVEKAKALTSYLQAGVNVVPKPVQVGVSAAAHAARIASIPKRLAPVLVASAPKTLSTVSTAAMVLGPIATVVDIGLLVYDWKKKQPNIENIKEAIMEMKQQKEELGSYFQNLKIIEDHLLIEQTGVFRRPSEH